MIDMIGDMKTASAQRSSSLASTLGHWISRQEISPDMAESGGEEGMKEQMKQAWRCRKLPQEHRRKSRVGWLASGGSKSSVFLMFSFPSTLW